MEGRDGKDSEQWQGGKGGYNWQWLDTNCHCSTQQAPQATCAASASRSTPAAARAARSARSNCCCVRAHCMSCSARCLSAVASALRAAMASQAPRHSARSAAFLASRSAASEANHSWGVTLSRKALNLHGGCSGGAGLLSDGLALKRTALQA